MTTTTSPQVAELLAHAAWVRRLARRLAADDGDDLVHEALLAARAEAPSRSWLAAVVRNLFLKRRLSDRRRSAREQAVGALALPVATPEELVGRVQTERLVVELVVALREPYRRAILLRYFEDLSAAAIARRLRIPAGTVRWRVKVGIDELRRALDDRSREWRKLVVPLVPLRRVPFGATVAVGVATALWLVPVSLRAVPPVRAALPVARATAPRPFTPPVPCELPALAELARLEAQRARVARHGRLFAEGASNPRAYIELAPMMLGVLKGDDAFPPPYTFECRTHVCRALLYEDDDLGDPYAAVRAARARLKLTGFAPPGVAADSPVAAAWRGEPRWSIRFQTTPIVRKYGWAINTRVPSYDPLTGKGLWEQALYIRVPPELAPPAPAPALTGTCPEQRSALGERIEHLRAEIAAARSPLEGYDKMPPNPALAAELAAMLRAALGDPTVDVECREHLCRFAFDGERQLAARRAFAHDPLWNVRVDFAGSNSKHVYYTVFPTPRLDGFTILQARLAALRASGDLEACETRSPARGLLRVRLGLAGPTGLPNDDDENGTISVRYGGNLAATSLGRCATEAVDRHVLSPPLPPGAIKGVSTLETFTFPLAH